jgi:hypothetical protein
MEEAMKICEWPGETPKVSRSIFQENDAEQEACYKRIIEMLNNTGEFKKAEDALGEKFNDTEPEIENKVKEEIRQYGFLLRSTWKKYEGRLKVHDYYIGGNSYFRKNKEGVHGVFMDIRLCTKDLKWSKAYSTIFHEFFHNIFYLAGLEDKGIIKDFGNAIVGDVNKLLEEENNKDSKRKRLNDLTFDKKAKMESDKKNKGKSEEEQELAMKHAMGKARWYKATLYDIIGAVLYRGRYGCHPSKPQYYIGKKCENKNVCKCICNKDGAKFVCEGCKYDYKCNHNDDANGEWIKNAEKKRKSDKRKEAIKENCVGQWFRKEIYEGMYRCTRENCLFKEGWKNEAGEELKFDFLIKCHPSNNYWCKSMHGHDMDEYGDPYWGEKTKTPTDEFLRGLAEEAFVSMAADAIVTPKAYENIMECLPNAYKFFERILMEILGEESKICKEYWKLGSHG